MQDFVGEKGGCLHSLTVAGLDVMSTKYRLLSHTSYSELFSITLQRSGGSSFPRRAGMPAPCLAGLGPELPCWVGSAWEAEAPAGHHVTAFEDPPKADPPKADGPIVTVTYQSPSIAATDVTTMNWLAPAYKVQKLHPEINFDRGQHQVEVSLVDMTASKQMWHGTFDLLGSKRLDGKFRDLNLNTVPLIDVDKDLGNPDPSRKFPVPGDSHWYRLLVTRGDYRDLSGDHPVAGLKPPDVVGDFIGAVHYRVQDKADFTDAGVALPEKDGKAAPAAA